MKYFTPLEYIYIAIANAYGLDRKSWDDRLLYGKMVLEQKPSVIAEEIADAKEPLLMQNAIEAVEAAKNQIPTGYMMNLDATNSGLQIMAALSGCEKTAYATNLINSGKVQSAYALVAKALNTDEKTCKRPTMTHFYNSTENPRAVFGEEGYQDFVNAVSEILPGAEEVKNDIQSCWSSVESHTWTLPDGHKAHIKYYEAVDKQIEIDELSHARFKHRHYENKPTSFELSLPAKFIG